MQFATVVLALASAVAAADSCSKSYSSKFQISVVKPSGTKRELEMAKRAACGSGDKSLTIQLDNGDLKDQNGRTGYIASNYQFQFDAPPQADHLETSGFEVCGNNSLALNGNAVWYQCLSGDFYNLYNKNWAPQCKPVQIQAVACDGTATGSGSAGSGSGSSSATAAPAAASPSSGSGTSSASSGQASQISDGQPQSPSAPAIATGAAAAYGPQVILAAAGLAVAALL